MSRRLKPVKDLSVLILAPRKHDRQLWAELLKNCGINNPISMSDIKQSAQTVGSGQVDVVFVDEAYDPRGIANILIPARNVEFAGGRGVCLILCSKKATAQDVMNARKLGFASLVILPASTDTVRKHLELASRYIPPTDEDLGWSAPKIKEHRESKAMPEAKDEPMSAALATNGSTIPSAQSNELDRKPVEPTDASQPSTADLPDEQKSDGPTVISGDRVAEPNTHQDDASKTNAPKSSPMAPREDSELPSLTAPGRSGRSAEEEVVFL